MKIVAVRDPGYAPCGWLVCQVADDRTWNTRDDARTHLVDSDWDFPSLASNWGFVWDDPISGSYSEAITAAWAWLEEHGSEPIDDPGYFSED
jgi:hypothetical protein